MSDYRHYGLALQPGELRVNDQRGMGWLALRNMEKLERELKEAGMDLWTLKYGKGKEASAT